MAAFFQNKIFQLVIFTLIPFIGGLIVGLTTNGSMYPWYDTINKPSFNPPSWVNFINAFRHHFNEIFSRSLDLCGLFYT